MKIRHPIEFIALERKKEEFKFIFPRPGSASSEGTREKQFCVISTISSIHFQCLKSNKKKNIVGT
jgi:hypothetical protein